MKQELSVLTRRLRFSDAWETAHGLDPQNPADRNGLGPDGSTNLERYLNQLAGARS